VPYIDDKVANRSARVWRPEIHPKSSPIRELFHRRVAYRHWPRIKQVVAEVESEASLDRISVLLTSHGFHVTTALAKEFDTHNGGASCAAGAEVAALDARRGGGSAGKRVSLLQLASVKGVGCD
jgi:hypothetical protein